MRLPRLTTAHQWVVLLDSLYKSIIYKDFFISLSPALLRRYIKKSRTLQARQEEYLKKKEIINVVFFLQSSTTWPYDALYRQLEADKRYNPIVVVIPYATEIGRDSKERQHVMDTAYRFAQQQGYNCICSRKDNGRWLDVRREINPDIVFFTFPYKNSSPAYFIYNYIDKLTLYVQYATPIISHNENLYNTQFHNLLWRRLEYSDLHKEYAEKYSICHGDNTAVIGMLLCEPIINPSVKAKDVWKPQETAKKRIIWAPHHSITPDIFSFSSFLDVCDAMKSFAERYSDKIQIAFKPHPLLKIKLIQIWGSERTEEYYHWWQTTGNTQLEEGDFIDLFRTSDAMVHDSGGFRAQYLSTGKPVQYILRDESVYEDSNEFGRLCIDMHYHAHNADDIEKFIVEVVLNGNDTMKEQRDAFVSKYFIPADGVMPTDKIKKILDEAVGK
ncbi:MAG: hypothetical protein IJR13_03980 [Bacteroidales bacterium]|nr:hypothetical protein [Bacteroidales bacterium]